MRMPRNDAFGATRRRTGVRRRRGLTAGGIAPRTVSASHRVSTSNRSPRESCEALRLSGTYVLCLRRMAAPSRATSESETAGKAGHGTWEGAMEAGPSLFYHKNDL